MSYNPKIHHRRSIRLKSYDYTQEGAYFITICTKNKQCIFGDIKQGEIKLNSLGMIAYNCWQEIPQHFPHIKLDIFVIMPNHIHGILWINQTISKEDKPRQYGKMVAGSIPCVIRSYKSAVTRQINQICNQKSISPVWQRNFYENINRNEESLESIRKYILNNPLNWENDSENPGQISLQEGFLLDIPF
ncbi:transposase [Rivularia sp. UHCC 0363]|uniref:transposase n=1 Tax=Rivularia sp. UHCC 0363 TaxID=3110244 RepID=UPI002B1F7A24|nr:transposase [Rivularia sp. UHCC 0363]MEA5594175.1 transposase [Rivularia sp. UHCC 0363]